LLAWARDGAQLLLILFLGVYVINVGYAFDHSFERLGDYRFAEANLWARDVDSPNKFAKSALGFLPVPLPRDYVLGIDEQKRDFRDTEIFLLRAGSGDLGGWWYYYLYGLAIQTPSGHLGVDFASGHLANLQQSQVGTMA